jgi:hypothetical protein
MVAVPDSESGVLGVPMKKRHGRQRKRKQSARHEQRAVNATQRKGVEKTKPERVSTPWLRILPAAIEDDASKEAPRGLFSLRNGRRQPLDMDVYIPEDNPRSR